MKIEIMEYNPDWTKNFEEEQNKIAPFFRFSCRSH